MVKEVFYPRRCYKLFRIVKNLRWTGASPPKFWNFSTEIFYPFFYKDVFILFFSIKIFFLLFLYRNYKIDKNNIIEEVI